MKDDQAKTSDPKTLNLSHKDLGDLDEDELKEELKSQGFSPEEFKQVTHFNCSNSNLCSLPENLAKILPGLTHINLARNPIDHLPELPSGVKNLNIEGCVRFRFVPSLEGFLQTINILSELEKYAKVIYPLRYELERYKNETEKKLDNAIKQYADHNSNELLPTKTKNLLSTFLNKKVNTSETYLGTSEEYLKKIIQDTNPTVEAFVANPQNLKWAEKVAKRFSNEWTDLVNMGWSEISLMMNSIVGSAKTVDKILEAKNYISWEESINHAINLQEQNSRKNYGYENEKNDELLKLKDEQVKIILEKTPRQIAEEFLLKPQRIEIWGELAFPEEVAEIEGKYADEIKVLNQVIKEKTSTASQDLESEYKILKSDGEFNKDDISSKTLKELKTLKASMLSDRAEEIERTSPIPCQFKS